MKGKKIRKIIILSTIFVVGLFAVISSFFVKPAYVEEKKQDLNLLNIDALDDVTNLEWVENSSATLTWDEVAEANYYHITVTVYENDGTTLIGSTTTGTTANQIDVQQEIYTVIGDNEYDYVKVIATVTSQFKQDDVVIKQGNGVATWLLDYQITNLIKIPTPTNLVFHEDYSVTFDCDIDDLSNVIHRLEYGVGVKDKYYRMNTSTSQFEVNGKEVRFQIEESFIKDMLRHYRLLDSQIIYVKVRVCAENDNYFNSEESDFSNYILYESSFEKIPTPTNLVFHEDYSVTFDCDIDDLSNVIHRLEYGVGVKDKYYRMNTSTSQFEVNGKEVRFQIEESFIKDMLRHYELTDSQIIYVKVKIYTDNDNYVNSEESDFSNYILYESSFEEIPTPTNLVFHEDYSVTFDCDIDDLSNVIHRLEYGVGVKDKYYRMNTSTSQFEVNGKEVRFQIEESFIKDMLRHYELTDSQIIYVKVKIYTDNDNYVNSEESDFSNYLVYDIFIPVESITLSPSTPYISKGNSYYLGKTITPLDAHYETIEWTSSDETIVTVDDTGKITGVSVGSATITAKIDDISTSVVVKVYELNTNIDNDDAEDITNEAGNIIDEIINNDDPNIGNTDIDENEIDDVTNEIINGIQNDFEFWINCNWNGFGLGHYKDIWDYIIDWYIHTYGENSWNFGWGYEIEYEIGYTDKNYSNHHLGNIVEFQNEYNITLDLPDDLSNHGNKKRNYCFVRCHNGEFEIIPVMIDGSGKIHAKSNKYSDFILLYEDVETVSDDVIYKKETHTATLGDDITINTYLELQDNVTNPIMTAWLDENNQTIINGEIQNDGRFKFRYGVAGPQMTSTIYYTITATKDDGDIITDVKTYSVRQYCEAIISNSLDKTMRDAAAQMLNYGAYAQIYFGYNTNDLANSNLEALGYSTELDTSVINQNAVASFDEFNGDKKAQFTTNALVFESEFTLKYYITLDEDVTNAYMAYRVKDSNDEYQYVELTYTGTRYYAKIEEIKAPLLTDYYETFICVKDGNSYTQISDTKYYSPECYATAIYNKSTNQNMKNVVVAMMMYCKAAKIHFGLD